MKLTATLLSLSFAAAISACATPAVTPAGQPSSTDVNPITGSRGGSGTSR